MSAAIVIALLLAWRAGTNLAGIKREARRAADSLAVLAKIEQDREQRAAELSGIVHIEQHYGGPR